MWKNKVGGGDLNFSRVGGAGLEAGERGGPGRRCSNTRLVEIAHLTFSFPFAGTRCRDSFGFRTVSRLRLRWPMDAHSGGAPGWGLPSVTLLMCTHSQPAASLLHTHTFARAIPLSLRGEGDLHCTG